MMAMGLQVSTVSCLCETVLGVPASTVEPLLRAAVWTIVCREEGKWSGCNGTQHSWP